MKRIDGMAESNYKYETTHIKQVHFKAKIVSCGKHPYSVATYVIEAIKKI